MEVRVNTAGVILYNMMGLLLLNLWAAFFLWLIVAGGLVILLREWLGQDVARAVGIITAAVIGGIVYILYSVRFIYRLALSRLAIEGDTVDVRGLTLRGVVERRYALNEIVALTIGEPLNATEQFFDHLNRYKVGASMALVKELRAGRLVVLDKSGGREVFHYIDKVFDPDSVQQFSAALKRQGVLVAGPG